MRTERFLIEDGDKLLEDLDEATVALARGDGRTKPRGKLGDYRKARTLLQKYVDDLNRLLTDGDVLPSTADDLLDDAAALIADVDELIAGQSVG